MKVELESFVEGDPLEVADEGRRAFVAATGALQVHPRATVTVFPAELWPFIEAWTPPSDDAKRPAENWKALAIARVVQDARKLAPMRWPTDPALRDQVEEVVARVTPKATRSVVVRKQENSKTHRGFLVDVRVAEVGLSAKKVSALYASLRKQLKGHKVEVRGIDLDPLEGTQAGGFVCDGLRCTTADEALIPRDGGFRTSHTPIGLVAQNATPRLV